MGITRTNGSFYTSETPNVSYGTMREAKEAAANAKAGLPVQQGGQSAGPAATSSTNAGRGAFGRMLPSGQSSRADNIRQVRHGADGIATINGKPLYALHANGVEAEVRFIKQPPGDIADMCKLVIKLMGKSFPLDFNKIDFDFYDSKNHADHAKTDSSGDTSTISVGLQTDIDGKKGSTMHGMMAFFILHEVFLHALPDLRTATCRADPTTADQDHHIILSPPNETNALHRAIKTVLPGIPNAMKQGFLAAYLDNVEDQINENPHVDTAAATRWQQSIEAHVNNPGSAFWSAAT